MATSGKLAMEILKALGVQDKHVHSFELRFSAGQVPTLSINRYVLADTLLAPLLEAIKFELVPIPLADSQAETDCARCGTPMVDITTIGKKQREWVCANPFCRISA